MCNYTSGVVASLISKVGDAILNPVLLALFAVAFVWFLYGVFLFVKNSEDSKARGEGIRHMFYGILGLVIMVSTRAIYDIVCETVNSLR